MLNGEFTATTHVEELYKEMPYGVTGWGELTGCDFDQTPGYHVTIDLDRKTGYSLCIIATSENDNPVFEQWHTTDGEKVEGTTHEVRKVKIE